MSDQILATMVALRSVDFLPVVDHDPGDEDDSEAKRREAMPWRIVRVPSALTDEERERFMRDLRRQCNDAAMLVGVPEMPVVTWPKGAGR